ncbi:MAG: hypothetical protein CDV28_1388 [Candidatus Electronema aureum]|uniref:CHC2 zinc finger n=1 Tax=Candidatus Electronema aureum TaxID=2005002 RepID=A0A521FZE7_9BACT|nr:MAG: hypothetical protein CDV28_1388 [Candidatus Electronema aureum]
MQKNELWYFSPLRKEKTASFKVNKTLNVWYDHGEGIGGTIIDLVILQFQTDISGALKKLQSIFSTGFRQVLTKDKKEIEPKSKILIKEIKPLSYFPLINYLQERKINISIAKNYLVEIYYKAGSKDYFAIGFKNDSG